MYLPKQYETQCSMAQMFLDSQQNENHQQYVGFKPEPHIFVVQSGYSILCICLVSDSIIHLGSWQPT